MRTRAPTTVARRMIEFIEPSMRRAARRGTGIVEWALPHRDAADAVPFAGFGWVGHLSAYSWSAGQVESSHDEQSPNNDSQSLLPAEARMRSNPQSIGQSSYEDEENTNADHNPRE